VEVEDTHLALLLHHNLLVEMVAEEMVLTLQVVSLESQLFYLLLVAQTLAAVAVEERYKHLLLLIIVEFGEHLVQLVDLV
jgi:hypothetical protein